MIGGYSGIGKSVLIHEIHKPIVAKRGYFISGKFDQFQSNIPYSAFIQAFQELLKLLLTETQEQLEKWKSELLSALGANGQVIIDVIPEVEKIIGAQSAVSELGSKEAQNRFNLTFQKFIQVFTQKEHPLVIFLDDLQWADAATLKLLTTLMSGTTTQHLLIVGAYRDNEVSLAHPFMITVEEIKKNEGMIQTLHLNPLNAAPLNQLLMDTLKTSREKIEDLTRLVLEKTGGNPFFVNEFLKAMHQDGLFYFDYEQSQWDWDLEKFRLQDITDNIVDLMVNKIKKLPEYTQKALQLGSCIGASFDLRTLSVICEQPIFQIAQDLWPAVQEGMLNPVGKGHRLLREAKDIVDIEKEINAVDKFQHDRVQQAAYALIEPQSLQSIHLKIGRLLFSNISEEQLEEKLFYVVEQFNEGRALIEDSKEKLQLIQLNLKAVKKAKDSTAYGAASKHSRIAIEMLPENSWQEHYSLTFSLYLELAETEYLSGLFDQIEEHFSLLLMHANSKLDKAEVYKIMMLYYVSIAENREKYKGWN